MAIKQANNITLIGVGAATWQPTLTGVTANNSLALIVVNTGGSASPTLPTDSTGQTWTQTFNVTGGGNAFCSCQMYHLHGANPGTHILSSTTTATTYTFASMVEFDACYALDGVSPVATSGGASTSLAANTFTTTTATDAVFAIIGMNESGTGLANANFSTPAGFTQFAVQNATNTTEAGEFAYLTTSSAGAQNATWTYGAGGTTTTSYLAIIVGFKMNTAGAVVPNIIFVNMFGGDD